MQRTEPNFRAHERGPQTPAHVIEAPPNGPYQKPEPALVLRLRRSQRATGVLSSKVMFGLDARADLSKHAHALAQKYGLGPLVIYDSQARSKYSQSAADHLNSVGNGYGAKTSLSGLARGLASAAMAAMTLRITVASLTKGHHIECKDLNELIAAEEAIREACNNIRGYLDVAETFDGREEVIAF